MTWRHDFEVTVEIGLNRAEKEEEDTVLTRRRGSAEVSVGAPTCPSPPALRERLWKLLRGTLAEAAASQSEYQLLPFLPEIRQSWKVREGSGPALPWGLSWSPTGWAGWGGCVPLGVFCFPLGLGCGGWVGYGVGAGGAPPLLV